MSRLRAALLNAVRASGCPRKEIAAAARMAEIKISLILRGKMPLSVRDAVVLGIVLDLSPEWLLGLQVREQLEQIGAYPPDKAKR